jgi:serine/threonine protein kinase
MAPEIILGKRNYDTKVDVWAFGIFAMELANGDPPNIQEDNERVIFHNILVKNMPPINSRWSNDF